MGVVVIVGVVMSVVVSMIIVMLSMISKDQLQSKISVEQDHLVKTDSRNAASTGTVLEAENKQIKDFHKELHQLRSLVQEISESNQEFLKHMQSWHASAFSDESSSMIKKILEFCSYEEPTTAIVATQTDAILQVSHPRLAVQQRPILTSEEPQEEPRREKREDLLTWVLEFSYQRVINLIRVSFIVFFVVDIF